ncbi:carbohydrate-binding family 9-like protein [Plebeiibacterium sediminum]|uniref:Carbohydrate-binding family 9-like protein n=1 Tax=Plebeiibacterium sediminum TaxID=2992112 RepID=A0AAE3M1W1_9BACT|nr:carbohydrate-binding family 9-like protein [Plebeiobacterium sediminum]MCW3785609.1 carbohydrate-binding family 9-like protein [Plebeiobacterium sediminum]
MLLVASCKNASDDVLSETNEFGLPYKPYIYKPTTYPLGHFKKAPVIDGINTQNEWDHTPWSSMFVSSISGKPENKSHETAFKMGIYNDTIYLLAKINEDQIWALDSKRNDEYFKDNFFEILIDCDNDEYDYLNIKTNALGIIKGELNQYEQNSISNKNIPINQLKIKCATYIQGTVNKPNDTDQYWQLEIGIPVNLKTDDTDNIDKNGHWKMNFVRSHWPYVVIDGAYKKIINSDTGKLYNGEQFIWAYMFDNPITKLELWGEVYVNNTNYNNNILTKEQRIKWELRNIFYAQKLHFEKHNRFANKIAGLKDIGFNRSALQYKANIKATKKHFIISIKDDHKKESWHIDDLGSISHEILK